MSRDAADPAGPDMPPHDSFYTRLKPSPGRGIGVFAIRDILPEINPFAGDRLETVRVPREIGRAHV